MGPPSPQEDVGLFTAWRVAFFGSISIRQFLVVFKPDPYLEIIKFVPDGILVTFEVTIMSILLALVIGLFTGLGRIAKNPLINGIASLYVEVIRAFLYWRNSSTSISHWAVIQLPPIPSAVLAMSICYGAYMGEIFRAATWNKSFNVIS